MPRTAFVHGPWLLVLALVSFLVATLPVAVMVWDADALELYRHAIVLCVVTQLVCLTFALLTAEALAERAGERYRPLLKAATSIPK